MKKLQKKHLKLQLIYALSAMRSMQNHFVHRCILLYNRDKTRNYDILILQDDIPGEAQEQIHALGKDEPGVSIRFINMREKKKVFFGNGKCVLHSSYQLPLVSV